MFWTRSSCFATSTIFEFFISLCYIVCALQTTFYEFFFSRRLRHSTFYEYLCTVHFLKTTFYDSTLQTCSYKSVLQLYSLNMYVLQSPFLFYKCNVFTKLPLYDCYPDNVYHSPCFCRLPFTCPRLSRFAHAVQILHS